jgi:hypothetical protein
MPNDDLPSRVAVLEQIARDTATALADIRTELRGLRTELREDLRDIRQAQRSDFRWLLGIMLGGFAIVLVSQTVFWLKLSDLISTQDTRLAELARMVSP